MSMSSIPSPSPAGKRYGWVEKIGNKVPHPFLLFIYLIVALIAATAILSAFNVGVQNPADGSRVVVKNLLSVEGLHWFLPNVIKKLQRFRAAGGDPRPGVGRRLCRAGGPVARADGQDGLPR